MEVNIKLFRAFSCCEVHKKNQLTMAKIEFVDNCYGKNYVRLLHVKREGLLHHMKELEVSTALTLDDTREYLEGDNSKIVATDSQKNTVYILAKKHGITSIEAFAQLLANHFLDTYPWVTQSRVYIEEKPWKRIQKQGQLPHNHAFIASGEAVRFCFVHKKRNFPPVISAGLKDMKVLKTTQSAFRNFVRDDFRSLPDADDRVFCTVVKAEWTYNNQILSARPSQHDEYWHTVKDCILDEFAGDPIRGLFSPSVQKTLYDTAQKAISKISQIETMSMELPNVHSYEFDLSKYPAFGITRNQEVFQPTDKPSGNIKAKVTRKSTSMPSVQSRL